jgi:hypothetical protein
MAVYSNKWSKRHLICICHVGCIEGYAVIEKLVSSSSWTINPEHVLYPFFIIKLVSEVDLKRKDTGGGKKCKKRKSLQTSLNPVASGALIHGLGTSIEQSW